MRLHFADELHGFYFRRSAQRAGRKRVDECLDGICPLVQFSAYPAYQVDDMTVILGFLVEIQVYVVAVAAQVVTRKVYQHHVFGVFFRVFQQLFRQYPVFFLISVSSYGAGDGVDGCVAAFNPAMRFGRRAEDAEAPKVEIKQIGRRVDASQCTVELEVVPFVALDEPP